MISNESGLFPAGRAILVRPYTPEKKESTILLLEETEARENTLEQRAVVVAVGPTAWHDEPVPRAKPGDKVLIGKFEGHMAKGPLDGRQYRFINDRAIFALLVDGETE